MNRVALLLLPCSSHDVDVLESMHCNCPCEWAHGHFNLPATSTWVTATDARKHTWGGTAFTVPLTPFDSKVPRKMIHYFSKFHAVHYLIISGHEPFIHFPISPNSSAISQPSAKPRVTFSTPALFYQYKWAPGMSCFPVYLRDVPCACSPQHVNVNEDLRLMCYFIEPSHHKKQVILVQ